MIGQKAALMMANMLLGTLLGLVALIFTGRYFETTHVGQVTYAVSIAGLFFFITDLGMGQAHVKRVSEGRDPGDCFATYAVFKLVATLAFLALVGGGVWLYHGLLGRPLEDTTLPIIVVVVGYYVARAIADVGQSSFDARLETAKTQAAQLTDTLLRVVLTIFFALVLAATIHDVAWAKRLVPEVEWVARDPALAFALATLAGSLGAAVVAITLLVRTLERGRFRWALLKDYAGFALPLFVSSSIILLSAYVDGAMLGFFRGAADAGIFGAVRRLPLVLAGFGTALAALLLPAVSSMLARRDHEGVERTTNGALRYLSIFLIPAAAFTAAFPREIIHLTLGDRWVAGAPALALLSIGVAFASFGHAHSFLLLGHGRSGLSARVGIASAVVLIVLNVLLIPDDLRSLDLPLAGLGITGAAIATLAANLVWWLGTRHYARTVAGFRARNHLLPHVAGALVMVAALLALDLTLLPLARWYHFPVYVATGGLVYLVVLIAWGEVTKDDYAFAKQVLHPGEMVRYITGEIRQRR